MAAVALLLLTGIAGSLWMVRPQEHMQVEIMQDGAVLCRLDLSQEENHTFPVEYKGRTNLIEIQNHQIRVLEAECPDQTCVRMRWLGDNGLPIVCLPNHLAIQFVRTPAELDVTA